MTAREVKLAGGSPWGFRMHGGADQNQPLRISRVNPGRKAALSGIREGDVITSINGVPTSDMSNYDAHAMLRSAGQELKLGLNEDKDLSPRRRSAGKTGTLELKRPSQLFAEMQEAVPQAPVYARTSQSPIRGHCTKPPNSSAFPPYDSVRYHPTNPFCCAPSNSPKLPIPNGSVLNFNRKANQSPANFRPTNFEENIFDNAQRNEELLISKGCKNNGDNSFSNQFKQNEREFKIVDCFSGSDYAPYNGVPKSNLKEILTRSTITEQEVKEYEEVKTVKKFILNGGASSQECVSEGEVSLERVSVPHVSPSTESVSTKPPLSWCAPTTTVASAQAPPAQTIIMPDRSKKRKRNRNKRNNKNNISSVTKTCGSDNQSSQVDSSVADEKDVEQVNSDVNAYEEATDQCNKNNSDNCEILKNKLISDSYVVEIPETNKLTKSAKTKISDIPKSKSLDDPDLTKIIEITDESETNSAEVAPLLIDNAVVSEAESDIEWEVAYELRDDLITGDSACAVGTLTVNTTCMNTPECEHTQPLSPEEELSLRQYLHTLNLVTCPQEPGIIEVEKEEGDLSFANENLKVLKSSRDESSKPKQRYLEVIDEEGSNESSLESRRQSYLKDDLNDLDDDVFHDQDKRIEPLDCFPKSGKAPVSFKPRLIQQDCVLVGAKILQPKIEVGCGDWTLENVEKITGAELIYLTDSSSSASDIYDIAEESDNNQELDESVVRINTPIIEINDAESCFSGKNSSDYADDAKTPHFSTLVVTDNSDKIIQEKENNVEIKLEEDKKPADITNEQENNDNININTMNEILVTDVKNRCPSLYVLRIDEEIMGSDKEDITNETKILLSHNKNNDDLDLSSTKLNNLPAESTFTIKEPQSNIESEINALKVELNQAISTLMNEVKVEKDNIQKTTSALCRQDSSSSIGSSQCTAKYNPTSSSLTDIANLVHETIDPNKPRETFSTQNNDIKKSHVIDVLTHVSGSDLAESTQSASNIRKKPIQLKEICIQKVASLPYGDKILEELANVSEQLQNISIFGNKNSTKKMPYYPLPDVSSIKKVSLSTRNYTSIPRHLSPPPITPRNSSLKIPHDELSWTGVPTKRDSSLYVCLSPSQKMLMEKTNTVIGEDDANDLLDTHRKYIDRRGYDEYYSKRKKDYNIDSHGAIPFRSTTGNRLLAIIRDPTVTSRVNSSNNHTDKIKLSSSYHNIQRPYEPIKPQYSRSAKDLRYDNSFRPIPPPRPRKYSSTLYESDESSEFTDHSFQSVSEKKYFHYSTGNLNKDIEKDVSNIQNLHRKCTTTRDIYNEKYLQAPESVRRPSLPRDLCEQQMEYIRQKEKEVEAEIHRLECENPIRLERRSPRAPLYSENEIIKEKWLSDTKNNISCKRDVGRVENKPNYATKYISSPLKSSQEEIMRDKMYSEYINQMAEREERKQHKIIKITTKPLSNENVSSSNIIPTMQTNEIRSPNNKIEEEFILKAKERWDKLGIKDPETEDERDQQDTTHIYQEPKVIEHKIKVIEGGEEKDVLRLPNHLREFVQFTAKGDKEARSPGESNSSASVVALVCVIAIVLLAVGKRMISIIKDSN